MTKQQYPDYSKDWAMNFALKKDAMMLVIKINGKMIRKEHESKKALKLYLLPLI